MGMETDRKPAQSKKGGRARSEPGKALRDGFQLRLLGPLTATRQGLDIPMPSSRKVRALLGYLALAPRPKLRSHLCELLWDVANDPRSELRWCLTKLRTVGSSSNRCRAPAQPVRSDVAHDVLRREPLPSFASEGMTKLLNGRPERLASRTHMYMYTPFRL
jgi:hypothetical protein